MEWIIDSWSKVGDAATAVTAAIALLSAVFALGQISSQARVAREVRATEAWDAYLRLCVERPELTSVAAFRSHYSREPNIDFNDNDIEDERYLWFLSVLLNASEQVLLSAPGWRSWVNAIEDQLSYHDRVLQQVWRRGPDGTEDASWRRHYSNRIGTIMKRVIPEAAEHRGLAP